MFNIFPFHTVLVSIFSINKKVLTHYKKRLKKLLLSLAILKGNKEFYTTNSQWTPRRSQGSSRQTPSNPQRNLSKPTANSMWTPIKSQPNLRRSVMKKLRSTKVKPKEISENLAWNTSKPDVMWCNVLCSWHGCHNPVRSSVQWAKSDSPLLRTSREYSQWPKKSNKTHCSQTVNDIFFT